MVSKGKPTNAQRLGQNPGAPPAESSRHASDPERKQSQPPGLRSAGSGLMNRMGSLERKTMSESVEH